MNQITAACGHVVVAVGAPGSPERLRRQQRACDDCVCWACNGAKIAAYTIIDRSKGGCKTESRRMTCHACDGEGWVRL